MTNEPIFAEFPKMARLTREVVVTEKIDGTNAQVYIRQLADGEIMPTDTPIVACVGSLLLYAGSRTRSITPTDDNFGFAAWVKANAEELTGLGVGRHFGEWWGGKIQRGYGLKEKRFSLFNTGRWRKQGDGEPMLAGQEFCPACCDVVPVLYRGLFSPALGENMIERLKANGSFAAPGFMKPEGIVIYHTAANSYFKKTVEKDESPKSLAA